MRVYHTTESYISLVNEIHEGKYDYSKTLFTKMSGKIIVICKQHGEFCPTAGGHKSTGCPFCYEARRGASLRMSLTDFKQRLKERPLYSLVSAFTSAVARVTLECSLHELQFPCTPTRLLTYKHTCPKCDIENQNKVRKARNKKRVEEALANLPEHISCLSKSPSWSRPEEFSCKYHGVFKSELDRSAGMEYMCNECAKDHWRGVARTPYKAYCSFLKKLFPNPLSKITLDEEAYSKGVGTKLIKLRCAEHGEFLRNRDTVNNGKLGTPCPYCKKSGVSTLENEVVEFMRAFAPCVQGDRKQISPKELDCFVPSKNLAVEFNGLYWHSEAKIDKNYHKDKNSLCRDRGIDLIQIFEDEWVNKKEICKSIISNRLGVNSSTFYGRKLSVIPCDFKVAREFLNANHIQGFVPAQRYLSLVDKSGEIRAVATFSYNRLKKDGSWELVRYCSALGTNVVGGLPKLVKHFLKAEGVTRLISYCCLRWFNGEGYKKAGFTLLNEGPPSYFYTNKQVRYSRHVAKKHKLKRLLPDFDEALTETENMLAAKFLKIYDCGNLLFEFNL